MERVHPYDPWHQLLRDDLLATSGHAAADNPRVGQQLELRHSRRSATAFDGPVPAARHAAGISQAQEPGLSDLDGSGTERQGWAWKRQRSGTGGNRRYEVSSSHGGSIQMILELVNLAELCICRGFTRSIAALSFLRVSRQLSV